MTWDSSAWFNAGPIRGEDGVQGPPGPLGPQGPQGEHGEFFYDTTLPDPTLYPEGTLFMVYA